MKKQDISFQKEQQVPASGKANEPAPTRPIEYFYEGISVVISAAIIILILFTFFFRFAGVVGDSMNPTLESGDWVVLSQTGLEYTPQRRDIVVISQPNALNENIIKRVIAVGGDTIDIDFSTGDVYVNGELRDEPYINNPTTTSFDVEFPLTVPEGYVFVMGDNRGDSLDSRSSTIGLIRNEYILGPVSFSVGSSGIQAQ